MKCQLKGFKEGQKERGQLKFIRLKQNARILAVLSTSDFFEKYAEYKRENIYFFN